MIHSQTMNIDVDISDLLKKAKDSLEAAESLVKDGFYDFRLSRQGDDVFTYYCRS
jgi:hypothetical protein